MPWRSGAGARPAQASRPRTHDIRTALVLLALAGLALATYLVADAGWAAVLEAIAVVGWGLVPVTAFHLFPLAFSMLSWREMVPAASRPSAGLLLWNRYIRESINSLLPVGQVGGDLVSVQLLHRWGTPGPAAAASMVTDLTVGLVTQLMFVFAGLVALLAVSTDPGVRMVAGTVLAGLAVLALMAGAFVAAQRRGMFALIGRVAGGLIRDERVVRIAGHGVRIDAAVHAVYADRAGLARAVLWRLTGWIAGTGEVWLLMHFLGKPITPAEAFILESFGAGLRAAAFLVPGAIGVLEAGFVVFGALFGITASDALLIALGKRVRELALGVPGLVAWQLGEGRRLFGRQPAR
ncbi:MAG: flippase-like domain-containing protein [Rhodospirillaceae bacterium]|nr:flippase-like domain-containing protein [Rhodospirillaceae bacterium]